MKSTAKKMKRILFSLVLALAIVTTSVASYSVPVHADSITTATITGEGVNFRNGPGTEHDSLGKLSKGTTGIYLEKATASTGKVWYKLTINDKTGWVHSDYVKLTVQVTSDPEFEAYLTAQGFPESYKDGLRLLHAMYPNWVFEAQHTNLEWATVIAEEYKLGRNLVHTSALSSWKSTQTGAYDWTTSTWKMLDSGGWVAASKEIIEHYMDPRNFLDKTNVFQFLKQSYDASTVDTEEVRESLKGMVKNTFLANGYDENSDAYIDDIMATAAEVKVSPYVLAAMIIQEQGTDGSGRSISGTVKGYEGYYNFFNIGAYKTSTMEAVERGLWYASGSGTGATSYFRPWNTRLASIKGGAKHYGEGFVSVGQDTMYLKKFDLVGTLYTHQYMTNIGGAFGEGKLMAAAYDEKARESALVFKIPVFLNMPATPGAKPTGTGSPNYMLKSLAVEGQSLTPTFAYTDTSYSLIVGYEVATIHVTATAYDAKAKITGAGSHNLKVGDNTIAVTVKAENGAERIYTIHVVRSETPDEPNPPVNPDNPTPPDTPPTPVAPTVSSTTYKITGNNITGLTTVPTDVTTFKSKLTVANGSAKVYNADGSECTGNIGTGTVVKLFDAQNNVTATYSVVVYGDTNGDGKISSVDLLQVKKHIVKASSMSGLPATAADVNKDGKVSSVDLLMVKKHIVKASLIQQ